MADAAVPARKEIREHSDYRAAVYGSVVVAALLGALYRSDASARAVAISVLSTTLVFWLAHLWASIVSEQIVIGQGFPWRRLPVLAAEEWPLVESGFIPLAPLVLAWIGVLSGDRGIHIALVFAIGQLVAWGMVVGRRSHDTWPAAIISGCFTGALGLALVALEMALH